jgi:MFS family permease
MMPLFTKRRPASAAKKMQSAAWVMVAILCLGQMLNYFDRSVVGLAATEIMRDLSLSLADYGLLSSAFFGLYGISGVVVGLTLSQRVRPRVLLTVLIAIWTIAQIPIVLAPSLVVLIISRALLGAAESPSISTSVAAAHEWFLPERRSVPTAFVMVGPLLGSMVAPPILISLMAAYGWKAGFVACGLLSAAVLTVLLIFGRDGPGSAVAPRAVAAYGSSIKPVHGLWSDPAVIAVTVVGFAAYWITAFAVAWLFPMLQLGLGYDQRTSSWLASGVYALSAILLLGISSLSQSLLKRGISLRRAVVWPMVACLTVGMAAFLGVTTVPGSTAKLILLAIGIGLMLPVMGAEPVIVSAVAPPEHRNRMLVVIMSLTSLAGMVSPYITGLLIRQQGFAGYVPAIELNAAVVLVGAVIALVFLYPDAAVARIAARVPITSETRKRAAS